LDEKQLGSELEQVAACAVIGVPATVNTAAAANTNAGNFLMVISSLFVTQMLHFLYKTYHNIHKMELH
jgi:hypothetical protein